MRMTASSASTPALAELPVDSIGVVGREAHAGFDSHAFPLTRGNQRHSRRRAGRRDLHPAVTVAEGRVNALLEPELSQVELERPVLVADGDDHGPYLADAGRGLGLGHLILLFVVF